MFLTVKTHHHLRKSRPPNLCYQIATLQYRTTPPTSSHRLCFSEPYELRSLLTTTIHHRPSQTSIRETASSANHTSTAQLHQQQLAATPFSAQPSASSY
ncbi:hypothetical protein RYX36_023983 [Vicia faba]